MGLIDTTSIFLLKKKLRNKYTQLMDIADSYSCGHTLLLNISATYSILYSECKDIYKELRVIDSECPKIDFLES